MTFPQATARVEWPTIAMIILCSLAWLGAIWIIGLYQAWWALPLVALLVTLHSSLQHEVIHGHPTPWAGLNAAMVFPAIGLLLPFHRFRDLHLQHHFDTVLTDPEDDPESPYVARERWHGMGRLRRAVLRANNTLAGRFILGPWVSMAGLIASDLKRGDGVGWQWFWHVPAVAPVLLWLGLNGVPIWLYLLLAAWPGMSILMIRTFAEHSWDPDYHGRSAIVERGGIFALLFLNNNLHAVHHCWPEAAWYRLPELRRLMKPSQTTRVPTFQSYGEVARRYLLRRRGPLLRPDTGPAT